MCFVFWEIYSHTQMDMWRSLPLYVVTCLDPVSMHSLPPLHKNSHITNLQPSLSDAEELPSLEIKTSCPYCGCTSSLSEYLQLNC